MRKAFYLAAAVCFGSLITVIPVSASAARSAFGHTQYYFLSFSRMARDIQNIGFLKFLSIDGQEIIYTHTNSNGKPPTRDAKLVWLGLGRPPGTTHVIINHDAYVGHRNRRGAKPLPRLTMDVHRPTDQPSSESDPTPNNLG